MEPPTGPSSCLLLDTNGELASELGRLEQILVWLAFDPDPDEEPGYVPDPVFVAGWKASGPLAIKAWGARSRVRMFAPDGRFELVPLSPVALHRPSVDTLGATIQALGAGLARRDDAVIEALAVAVEQAACSSHLDPRLTPADLVAAAAQAHALLDLAFAPEVPALRDAMPPGGDWVLSGAEFEEYRALTNRVLSVWGTDPSGRPSGLLRWLHFGW